MTATVVTGLAAQDKLLARIPLFSGQENEFRTYQLVLETVLGESNDTYTTDFELMKVHPVMIDVPDTVDAPGPYDRCRTLYFVLVMTTRGEAQVLVQTAGKHNGYEAYRMLCLTYDAATSTKGLGMLQ